MNNKKRFTMNKMMIFLLVFNTMTIFSQEKLTTKKGIIKFEASVPSFEEIKAQNENVSCVLNTKTGEIASLALVKGFRFKIALMEEHFNENYIESDKYPKATFKGKIQQFDLAQITEKAAPYKMTGTLEIRGKSKAIETTAMIKKTSKGIEIKSAFDVSTDDFGIEIPSVVSKKVSKKVEIETLFEL
jgi:hypothetical protein